MFIYFFYAISFLDKVRPSTLRNEPLRCVWMFVRHDGRLEQCSVPPGLVNREIIFLTYRIGIS